MAAFTIYRRPGTTPLMRGRMHQFAFVVAIPAVAALVVSAPSAPARAAALVYGLGLSAMFGASATYHLYSYSHMSRAILRRLDHSMIFVLIAATYTPFALLALDGAVSWTVLVVVWAGAAFGVSLSIFRMDQVRVVKSALYFVLGWMAVVLFPLMITRVPPPALALLVLGGVIYTAGAVCLGRRRPDPLPLVFGYHEVWHACVVAAAACHFAFVAIILFSLG